jgi:hypothetical protein
MPLEGPQLHFARTDAPEAVESSTLRTVEPAAQNARYRRALELALEIERLLEPQGAEPPPSARGRSARIAQATARSLIDQLAEIARNSAA